MDNFRDVEMIEKYLSKVLDAPTTAAFEKAMQKDEVLKESVLAHQDILKGIEIVLDKDLTNSVKLAAARFKKRGGLEQVKLQSDMLNDPALLEKADVKNQKTVDKTFQEGSLEVKEQKEPAKIKSLSRSSILLIAASLLFLLTAGYYFTKPPTTDQLYATYATINKKKLVARIHDDLDIPGLVNTTAKKDSLLKRSLEIYRDCTDIPCEYNSLNRFLKQFPEDKTALFCKVLTDMKAKKEEGIIVKLEKLRATAPIERKQDILWYLGLAYLKQENSPSKAIRIFEQIISDTKSPYISESQQLLKELGGRK